jgi:hypothetical protein
MAIPPDPEAEKLLERLSDLENHPNEALTPYEEVRLNGKVTVSPSGQETC